MLCILERAFACSNIDDAMLQYYWPSQNGTHGLKPSQICERCLVLWSLVDITSLSKPFEAHQTLVNLMIAWGTHVSPLLGLLSHNESSLCGFIWWWIFYVGRYFAVPYPLPKMDMIAIPDFASGAMENYGLVTYRETALLFDEKHSAAANKQRVGHYEFWIVFLFQLFSLSWLYDSLS